MTRAVVLGAGMVGSIIAEDLVASGYIVTLADRSEDALARVSERSNGAISIAKVDCSNQDAIANLASSADIVFGESIYYTEEDIADEQCLAKAKQKLETQLNLLQ